MRRNAYGGYRGRRTGRDILKLLIALLLVLVVVLAGIAFFGRDQLGLPEQPESSQSDPTPAPEQPEQMPEPAPEPEPEPEPAPVPKPEVMAAVEISLEQLLDGSYVGEEVKFPAEMAESPMAKMMAGCRVVKYKTITNFIYRDEKLR